jgi:hypothetical protein
MSLPPTDGDENAFVARASRRAASTVVSTFCSAVTEIRLEVQREINALPPLFSGEWSADALIVQTGE